MPDVSTNRELWTRGYGWADEGDEWSSWWGGTDAMWFGAVLPRIHAHLPAPSILEIGPGYGRWTQYLKEHCERLVGVDLAENCVEHCRQRFAADGHIEFHANDGRSLEMVEDGSVDFVFSFDSLVHAEPDVVAAYLQQLAAKLTPDGIGFVHHSNHGAQPWTTKLAHRLPEPRRRRLVERGVLPNVYGWRSPAMTSQLFAQQCRDAGLVAVTQERVNWVFGPYLIDAMSTFTRAGSVHDRDPVQVRNPLFRQEARRMSRLYAARPRSRAAMRSAIA